MTKVLLSSVSIPLHDPPTLPQRAWNRYKLNIYTVYRWKNGVPWRYWHPQLLDEEARGAIYINKKKKSLLSQSVKYRTQTFHFPVVFSFEENKYDIPQEIKATVMAVPFEPRRHIVLHLCCTLKQFIVDCCFNITRADFVFTRQYTPLQGGE